MGKHAKLELSDIVAGTFIAVSVIVSVAYMIATTML